MLDLLLPATVLVQAILLIVLILRMAGVHRQLLDLTASIRHLQPEPRLHENSRCTTTYTVGKMPVSSDDVVVAWDHVPAGFPATEVPTARNIETWMSEQIAGERRAHATPHVQTGYKPVKVSGIVTLAPLFGDETEPSETTMVAVRAQAEEILSRKGEGHRADDRLSEPRTVRDAQVESRRRRAGYPEAKVREASRLFLIDGVPTRDAPGLGYAWDPKSGSMRSFAYWGDLAAEDARKESQREIERLTRDRVHALEIVAEWNAGRHPVIVDMRARIERLLEDTRALKGVHAAAIRDLRASYDERLRKAEERRNAAEAGYAGVRAAVAEELEAHRGALRVAEARIAELEGPEVAQARIDERVAEKRQQREARDAEAGAHRRIARGETVGHSFDLDQPAPVYPVGDDPSVPMVRTVESDVVRTVREAGAGIIAELQRQHEQGDKA